MTLSIVFECIASNPSFEVIGVWLLLAGFVGLISMGIDKARAIHGEWRISERTLFITALVGGFWGVILGGELFHHKTSKFSFLLPVFGIAAVWSYLLFKLGFLACLLSSVAHP